MNSGQARPLSAQKPSTEAWPGQQLSYRRVQHMMKTRGKILRQPGQGPGIVMIEGQQFRFQLEGVWQSDIAPQPGQAVEVHLDRELQVIGLSVVMETQVPNQVDPNSLHPKLRGAASTGILGKLYAKVLGRDRQNAKSSA
jgi:hypothetical protein